MKHSHRHTKRWLGVVAAAGVVVSGTVLPATAAPSLVSALAPAPVAAPELNPIDPQHVSNLDNLTWDDFKPIPGKNWADPSIQPTIKKWNAAVVLVDYPDQPFSVTLPQGSTPFGTPGPLAHDIPRDQVPQFYKDLLNTPSAINNYHTLNEYWMENTGGRYGVELTVYGPYKMPKKSYQYHYSAYGNGGTLTETKCPTVLQCNGNMRNDALALWKTGTGKSDPIAGFSNVFYVGSGEDQSSTWLEFGQMMFKNKEDVPNAFGPPQEWKDAVKTATGKDAPNWAPTRYVPWTSWVATASIWPNATVNPPPTINTSIEGESSGRGTYAHEFSHNLNILDNYGNPYADNPRRDTAGPFDMMSRGSFNGPGGPHQRWGVPSVMGNQMGSEHMLRDKIKLGFVNNNDVLTVNRDDLKNQGMTIARNVTAREVQIPGQLTGLQVTLGTGSTGVASGDLSSGTCTVASLPDGWKCDGGNYNTYTLEVVDQMGTDSYLPDSGVLIAKNKISESSGIFKWAIDAHPEDIDLIDYYMADGTPVKLTRGDHRQLNDALFHAGTNSGSLNEYVDTANRLQFYVLNKHRDAQGVLSYDLAVRSLDGAGPNARGVATGDAVKSTVQQFAVGACTFPVKNTGAAGVNPANPAAVDSDVYRLSSTVAGAGWTVSMPNNFVSVKAGESVSVPVYAVRGAGSSDSVDVSLTATSESNAAATATANCTLTVQDLALPAGSGASGPGVGYQVITTGVSGGALGVTFAGSTVTMPAVTLTGFDQIVAGALNSATVVDARGTAAGWSLTGQVSDFVGPNGLIMADNLGWTPSLTSLAGSLPTAPGSNTAAAGPGATPGSGTGLANSRTLCAASVGGGGGAFSCGAALSFGVPGSTKTGTYTGVLTVTLV